MRLTDNSLSIKFVGSEAPDEFGCISDGGMMEVNGTNVSKTRNALILLAVGVHYVIPRRHLQ